LDSSEQEEETGGQVLKMTVKKNEETWEKTEKWRERRGPLGKGGRGAGTGGACTYVEREEIPSLK
jgi:hypothetical protein